MSTVASLPALRLRLTVPRFGAWALVADLDATDVPSGRVTALIGQPDAALELTGTVIRAGLSHAGLVSVIVAPAPGWTDRVATPRSWHSSAGVRLATVLSALSSDSGEELEQPTDRVLGVRWGYHAGGTYAEALSRLASAGAVEPWRIGSDAVLRFGARVGSEVEGRADVMMRDESRGIAVVGCDEAWRFFPGATLQGREILHLVAHEVHGQTRAEVWLA